MKTDKLYIRAAAVSVIAAAYICRLIGLLFPGLEFFTYLRLTLHIGLFSAWGFSLNRRLVQKKVKKYLLSVVVLLLLWIILKTLKYRIISDPAADRYLWYLYYIPMLLIPYFALLAGWCMGQPENCRQPAGLRFLWLPTIFLILLVLTNDLHQQVFVFPRGASLRTISDTSYSYGPGYGIVLIWMILLAFCALGIMISRCRVPMEKSILFRPLFPMLLLILYGLLYVSGISLIRFLAGDLCIVFGLLYMDTCENLIRCHLIQSNSCYADLFHAASDSCAQITDNHYAVRYAASGSKQLTEDQMRLAEEGPVMISEGIRLHNMQIAGGHILWTEDVSELTSLQSDLKEAQEELRDRSALLKLEYEQDKNRKTIEEQNRLYDLLNRCTQKQIDRISVLVTEYENKGKNAVQGHDILAQIAVLCTYVKRRKHLTLSIYSHCRISAEELKAALKESMKALELLHIRTSIFLDPEISWLDGEIAAQAYDFFETAAEVTMDDLRWIFVSVNTLDEKLRISIRLSSKTDLSQLPDLYPEAIIDMEEPEEWSLIQILKGGTVS